MGEGNEKAVIFPLKMDHLNLKNCVVMVPVKRARAEHRGEAPAVLNALYFARHNGAGFIVTEGTQVSRRGQGYAYTPGIHSNEQVAGWRI